MTAGALEVRVEVWLPARELEPENLTAIRAWIERAVRRRFAEDAIDVEETRKGIAIVSLYRPGLGAGALSAAVGVLDLVEQSIELALLDTRPARARRALERLFARLEAATVTVTPLPVITPKGPQA